MDNIGIISVFTSAGIVLKVILLLLLLMSIVLWSIAINNLVIYKNIKTHLKKLNDDLEHSQLDLLYEKNKMQNFYGNYSEYINFIQQIYRYNKQNSINMQSERHLSNMLDNAFNKNYLLAIIASSAPFIGLLGTVLGIIKTFSSIGLSASISLSVIAPGIAESLYLTACGLFVAIPSSIFYNLTTNFIIEIEEKHKTITETIVFLATLDKR